MIPLHRGTYTMILGEGHKRDPLLTGCRLVENETKGDLHPGQKYRGGLVDHLLEMNVPPGGWFWLEPKE